MKKIIITVSFIFAICITNIINTADKTPLNPKRLYYSQAKSTLAESTLSETDPKIDPISHVLDEELIQKSYINRAKAQQMIDALQTSFNEKINQIKEQFSLFKTNKRQQQDYLQELKELKKELIEKIKEVNLLRNPSELQAQQKTQKANVNFYNKIKTLLEQYPDFKNNKTYRLKKAELEAQLYQIIKNINLRLDPSCYISKEDANALIDRQRTLFDKNKAKLEQKYPNFKTDNDQKKIYALEMELLGLKGRVAIKEADLLRNPSELKAKQLTIQEAYDLTQKDKDEQDQEEQLIKHQYLSNPDTYNRSAFDKARKDIERKHEMQRLDYIRRTIDPETPAEIALRIEMDELRDDYKKNRLKLRDTILPKGSEKFEAETSYQTQFAEMKTTFENRLKDLVSQYPKPQRLYKKSHL